MTWNRAVRYVNAAAFLVGVLLLLGVAGWIEGQP